MLRGWARGAGPTNDAGNNCNESWVYDLGVQYGHIKSVLNCSRCLLHH